jgi:hypothetical protein
MSISLIVSEQGGGSSGSGGGYSTALDLDFTAQPTQTLSPDGAYTIGGQTFTKINSSGDNTAMVLTNGTGIVIKPNNGVDYSQGGRTLPALTTNLAAIVPGFSLSMPLRIWLYISSDNPTANFDNTVQAVENGGLNWSLVDKKGYFTNNGWYVTSLIGGTNQSQAGSNVGSSQKTSVLDIPEGILGCSFGLRTGAFGIGTWPSLASLSPQFRYLLLNGTTDYQALYPSMGLASAFDLLLGAQTTSNQGTYSTTLARLRIDYVPAF